MRKIPKFANYSLDDTPDKHGVVPKLGDHIRISLYDGVENVVTQITVDENNYYQPYVLKYLEYEIYDGIMHEDDTPMESLIFSK